jgi:hypothetical protein
MALGDIYRCVFSQILEAQQIQGIYYYFVLNEAVPSSAADVANIFSTGVVPAMNNIQSAAVSNEQVYVTNIMSLDDLATLAIAGVGAIAGGHEATILAWKFRLNRNSRASRNGSKAIGGIPSSSVLDGAPVVGVLGALAAFATQYAVDLPSLAGNTYRPVIYRQPDDAHPFGQGFYNGGAEFVKIGPAKTRALGRGI